MKNKGELAPPESRRWTRVDDYLIAMARRRTARRIREPLRIRTQPEAPRLLLSTIPFLALIGALAVMAIAIMVAAWPGAHPRAQQRPVPHEQGVAPKGWFQEAGKQFQGR